ncbi:hypothetical protein PZH42_31400, partial [Bacteroides cellulosilyticus]
AEYANYEVTFPDGRRAIYGTSDKINYHISQMTHKSGAVVNYTNAKTGNHYRIEKITYGKSKQAWISFQYTSRPSETQRIFNAGREIIYDYQLSSIT